MTNSLNIKYDSFLGGYRVVRGEHEVQISGHYDTEPQAQACLDRVREADRAAEAALYDFNYVGSRHHY